MVYTPSWKVVSDEQIVSPKMLERIRHSGSESAYQKGDFIGHSWVTESFGTSQGERIMSAEKTDMKKATGSMKKMGILTVILGILAMAMPWITGQSILLLIGILVTAGGVIRMIWAFKAGSLGKGILVFLIGVLTLLAGIAIIANPILTSGVLTLMLAFYFFVDGFAELMAAFAMPGGRDGKGWLVFDGAITILLGIAIFTGFPLAGILAIGVFLGIKLLFVGLTMLTLGSAAKEGILN